MQPVSLKTTQPSQLLRKLKMLDWLLVENFVVGITPLLTPKLNKTSKGKKCPQLYFKGAQVVCFINEVHVCFQFDSD